MENWRWFEAECKLVVYNEEHTSENTKDRLFELRRTI